MTPPRIGIWFIGARGGVASTATLGLVALQKGLTDSIGLVSGLPQFAAVDFAPWESFAVGGHEIREGTIHDSLERLRAESRVLDTALIESCRDELDAIDGRIRPGTKTNCGRTISDLAGPKVRAFDAEPVTETIRRLQDDLRSFQKQTGADRVIVVNLASTEPTPDEFSLPERWDGLAKIMEDEAFDAPVVRGSPDPAQSGTVGRPTTTGALTASSLYAIAALDLGMQYINFTPSAGASPAAIQDLAVLRGTCHAGQDGKTGETLLKSVLAPMFAARNLQVLSWVGHNIFGNLDGLVLDDPANKASKIKNKDQLIGDILGYDPQTLVSIEYIRSLGDWKTAWDHIHFRGFLGTPMTLQFTWQGCDSLLAAPLVLDLIRFVEVSSRRGETGVLSYLGSFFKRPIGLAEHDFSRQFWLLSNWAAQHSG